MRYDNSYTPAFAAELAETVAQKAREVVADDRALAVKRRGLKRLEATLARVQRGVEAR
jgi:hypothetical protein